MKILFQDEYITVCLKPAGVISEQSDKTNVISLIKEQTGVDTFAVHRLDRETAGVMVYANSSRIAAQLSLQIQNNAFEKHYLAVVSGTFEETEGIMSDLLYRDRLKNKSFVAERERSGVKKAELEYKIIGSASGYSLADILLHTGRTHQIRVQFSSRSHPVYGDGKYGGSRGDLALFAYRLSFTHPVSDEKMCFEEKPDFSVCPWNFFEL